MRFALLFILLTAVWPLWSQVNSCGSELANFPDALSEKWPDISDRTFLPLPKGGAPDTVAVTIHIITDGKQQALSIASIDEELAGANHFFSPAGLFFQRCGPVRVINGKIGYNYTTGNDLNREKHVSNTINIYFAEWLQTDQGGPICGFSSFPWMGKRNDRYIMMARPCLDGGVTLAHEIGHFYGLYHTHETLFGEEFVNGSNCKSAGDLICDTAADPNLYFAYITEDCDYRNYYTDPFGNFYNPPVLNLMSYAPVRCRQEFSPQQNSFMRTVHDTENAYLYQNCEFYPDFMISFKARSGIVIRSGDSFIASYSFTNIGVNQDYDLDLHFSITDQPDAQGVPVKQEELTVSPGQTAIERKFVIDFPGNLGSGQYYLTAKIDAFDKIVERQEENNAARLAIEVNNSSLQSNALLFPNPVGDELNFFLRDESIRGPMTIRIYRYDGRLIRTFEAVNKQQEEVLQRLQVANLPAGIYLLTAFFETGGEPYTFSFLKK